MLQIPHALKNLPTPLHATRILHVMFFLLALLYRFTLLLPQSWRAFAQRPLEPQLIPNTPQKTADLQHFCNLRIDLAETDEARWVAISFDHRTRQTALSLDRSTAFNPHRPRRMALACRAEAARASFALPESANLRALELSG